MANHLFDELRFLCERGIRFSAEDMLSTIQSEKEEHHPYAISLLLKISDGFRTEEFRRLGLIGSSEDWERLVRGVIQEFEENNSGVDLFHFDSHPMIVRLLTPRHFANSSCVKEFFFRKSRTFFVINRH